MGTGFTSRYELVDGQLNETFLRDIEMGRESRIDQLDFGETVEINWVDVTDLSQVEALEAGEWDTTATA